MEKARFLLLCMLLAVFTFTASAQRSAPKRAEAAKVNDVGEEGGFQMRTYGNRSSLATPSPRAMDAMRVASGDSAILYGSVVYDSGISSSDVGIYKFVATADSMPTAMMTTGLYPYGGCYDSDNEVYISVASDPNSYYISDIYLYDPKTWKQQSIVEGDRTCLPTDMTYNPVDQKVYGCFYATSSTYQFGTLDYKTGKMTSIKNPCTRYYAMACNSKGEIYAIDVNGQLYKVDPASGDETLIGSTGFYPYYLQSATFDFDTDKLYWFATNGSRSRLMEVNTSTAETSIIVNYDSRSIEVTGAFSMGAATEANAPAKPVGFSVTSDEDELTGDISFTLPSYTYGGDALTGSLDWTLIDNDSIIKEGTGDAGTSVTLSDLSFTEGLHTFVVYASNSEGNGEKARQSHYFGFDTPQAPSDIVVTKSATGTTVSWKPVTVGVHNGYVGNITYTLKSQPDNVTLAEGLTDTTFLDTHEVSELTLSYYELVATTTSGVSSATAQSAKVLLGDGVSVPYTTNFSKSDDSKLYTVHDANGDGITWKWASSYRWYYRGSITECGDDWLFTPKFKMKKGNFYRVTFSERVAPGWNTEKLEIKYGKDTVLTAMDYVLLPETSYHNKTLTTNYAYVYAPEDGNYSLGFHCVSDSNQYTLFLKDFSIGEAIDEHTPDTAYVKLTPASLGELKNTITLTTPTKDMAGNALSSLTEFTLINTTTGDTIAHVTSGLSQGETLTYTDSNPAHGYNCYETLFYNDYGYGRLALDTCYVGEDLPDTITNIRVVQDGMNAVLTWDKPSNIGPNGGYVDADHLNYRIVLQTPDIVVVEDSCSATTFTDTEWASLTGQRVTQYAVFAENSTGRGEGGLSDSIIIGVPYTESFVESFADKSITTRPWINGVMTGYASWDLTSQLVSPAIGSQDYDDGLAIFYPYTGGTAMLHGPIVDLSTIDNPALSFYYNMKDASMAVEISVDNGVTWNKLCDLSKTGDAWTRKTIDLQSYKDQIVCFGFAATSAVSDYQVGLDNVQVATTFDVDLAPEQISVPGYVVAGDSCAVSFTVTNKGYNSVEGYTVTLLDGDKTLASKEITEPLAADAYKTMTLDIPTTLSKDSMTLKLLLYSDEDENTANDSCSYVLNLKAPKYPVPLNLKGSSNGQSVSLSWEQPKLEGQLMVTDDAEDYEPWTIGGVDGSHNIAEGYIGDYKLYDGDGETTYYIYAWPTPNYEEPQAAIVFNDSTPYSLSSTWGAHSGHQYFAFFSTETGVQNDDYLILPRLGTTKTVSFYAKSVMEASYGKEKFQMMISGKGNDISDFTAYGDVVEVPTDTNTVDNGYTYYTFTLPDSTNYAAIRYMSLDQFCLFIDDISYYPAYGDSAHLQLTGYNVYRNGEKVNGSLVTTPAYVDNMATSGEQYTWNVSAVYTLGESTYSNDYTVSEADAISSLSADNASLSVSDGSIQLTNFTGEVSIYDTVGRQIVRQHVDGAGSFNVPAGIYVVVANNERTKVVVR